MDNALIGAIVHVGKKRQPVFRHFVARDGKTVVLGCHEAAPTSRMQTRLIVPTIAVSMFHIKNLNKFALVLFIYVILNVLNPAAIARS